MQDNWGRRWIWPLLGLQFVGYVYDAVWHGSLNPGAEPHTASEMARHLATVHLPLYIGAAGVLLATFTASVNSARRSAVGTALPFALAGATLSAGAEAWHAYAHLRLDTRGAPVAGILSIVGFLIVVTAVSTSAWRNRRRGADASQRRAA